MCLPCFPWTWTQYEDPLDNLPPHSVWVHDGNGWSLQQVVSLEHSSLLIQLSLSTLPCRPQPRPYSFIYLCLTLAASWQLATGKSSSKRELVLHPRQIDNLSFPSHTYLLYLCNLLFGLYEGSSPFFLVVGLVCRGYLYTMNGSSPKPPRPLPPPHGIDRGVRFDAKPKSPCGMKYQHATVEDVPEAGPSRQPPNGYPGPSSFANKGKGKAREDPIEKPRHTQPSSFPSVGLPPNNHVSGAPWLVAANPSQSLAWPGACHPYGGYGGLPAVAGPWAPGVTESSLACHFYAPPPHLVNNIAYPAFTHQHNPFGPVCFTPFPFLSFVLCYPLYYPFPFPFLPISLPSIFGTPYRP